MPRRLINGLMFALMVGVMAALVSVIPALFIQTIFISEAERCDQLMRTEAAAFDEVRTTCEEDLGDAPFWFPTVIIWTGASLGALGGFGYGMFRPPRGGRQQPPNPHSLASSRESP